jgi:hypothetical protein
VLPQYQLAADRSYTFGIEFRSLGTDLPAAR